MAGVSFTVNVTLDTKGLDSLIARLPGKAAELVETAARNFEQVAKDGAPVDTGNLKSSISAQPGASPLHWVVRDGTAYGIYQEFGVNHPYTINSPVNIKGHWVFIKTHPGFKAQPFWMPALESTRNKFISSFSSMFS
jgi:HK97 gp10 family phage protein